MNGNAKNEPRHCWCVIDPRGKTLRKARQGGYGYRRLAVAGEARFTDAPDKNRFSHVAEALQYALVGAGEDRRAVNPSLRRASALEFRVLRGRH